jgi:hypothetical protein
MRRRIAKEIKAEVISNGHSVKYDSAYSFTSIRRCFLSHNIGFIDLFLIQ